MEETLEDALKVQSSLLPWRKAVENFTLHCTNDGTCDLVLPPCSMHTNTVFLIQQS